MNSIETLARRGGRYPVWAPTVAVGAARRLRCDAQRTRAAAMPLASGAPAPLLHGFSPVRPWRAGLPLALLRFSPRHKSPTPDTAHRAETLVVRIDEYLSGAGKAAVDCSSAANEVSGASFDAGHAIEERKGVGPQGRPPYTSAGAYPAAALPRSA